MAAAMKEAVENLNENPSDANWEALAGKMRKGSVKYYHIFESQKGGKKAYAVLYDARYRSLFRVPTFDKKGRKIKGVEEYLKCLLPNNKEEKSTKMGQAEERERVMQKLKSLGYI